MKKYTYSEYSYVTVFEVPKKEIRRIDMSLCRQPRETLSAFYGRQSEKPDFLINGGFFSMADGTTCFNYIDEKNTIASNPLYTKGFGIIDDAEILFGDVNDGSPWRDFITAYPPLVENGKKTTIEFAQEINYNARRSAVGYNDDTLFFVAVELPGLGFAKLQSVMLSIGCTFAINLDGGGSTNVIYGGDRVTSTVYNRAVDNVIAVYTKKEEAPVIEEKIIYRVQAGAFKSVKNAEKLKNKISRLDDKIGAGYAKAYIRLVNGLYKVQVGAFSKKENAERVVNDMKNNGISPFITTK